MRPDTPQLWKDAISTLPPDGCDTAACPEPEQIWSAVRGEFTPDRFGELADHAATCPVCALAWQLAGKYSTDHRRPWQVWYGLAAAAVLVAAAAMMIQFRGTVPAPVISTPEYRAPVEETVLSELSEDAVLPRDACTLRWSGPAEATFGIQIADESFFTVHRETGLTGTAFTVPPEALERIPAGGVIVWQVEAVLPDGTRKLSRTFRATIE